MEPVRIKLYGLISITKRGYIAQLIFGGLLLVVLLVVWSMVPHQKPPGVEDLNWQMFLLQNLPFIIFVLATLYTIEAFIVFRRFARAEAEQKTKQSKK